MSNAGRAVAARPGPSIVPLALTTTQRVLKVVDGVSAVVLRELGQEVVIVAVITGLLDVDALVAVSELVDDVLGLLAKLELLESRDTLSSETDTVNQFPWISNRDVGGRIRWNC